MKEIIIQGIRGCYHEIAATKFYPNQEIKWVEAKSFEEMFKLLEKRSNAEAIMAIENTIAGNLLKNHELLRKSQVKVVGEQRLRIKHTLACLPGQELSDIREIHSHPIALMQCEKFLSKLKDIKIVETEDTALSAKRIAEEGRLHQAAICSRYAAELYELNILAESIETNKRNFTRFLVLNQDDTKEKKKINKSSLVFSVQHTKGSLSKVLTILSFYDIDLTKIQSMPIIGKEWEYRFYIDVTFENDTEYSHAIEAILPFTKDFKILGEYEESK